MAKSAVLSVGLSILIGGLMICVSIYALRDYGSSLFIGTPFMMGAAASYFHNRPSPRSYSWSLGVGLAAVFFGEVAMMLFAFEGAICLLMAAPIVVPLGAMGGLLGKAIADATRRSTNGLIAATLLLPVMATCESCLPSDFERMVETSVDINASPERVWNNVINFPKLTEKPAWFFRWGIACPESARIDGEGVGAIRHCVFTTGAFTEPITVWEPLQRLAFDVTDQPEPMFELSPYRNVHPPHLEGFMVSKRGEFRLVKLDQGRTRLVGRTWYACRIFPQFYWTLWTDGITHGIHHRVLRHIQQLTENENLEVAVHSST